MSIQLANPKLLENTELYAVVAPWNAPHFDYRPLGLEIPSSNRFNPCKLESEQFLLLLQEMDRITFGPEGMPMPRWVFYNCSEVPGGIVGFGKRASLLSDHERSVLSIPSNYDGLVPFSMFIAIPMLPSGDWMGHNLCSLNGVFPEAGLRGLGSTTKALGLKVYRTRRLFGATQWRSRALHIHLKFGPLDLVTAFTPAHSESMTLTYRVDLNEACLRAACGDPGVHLSRPAVDFWLDADDVDAARSLQDKIEAGGLFQIVERPRHDGEKIYLPISEAHPQGG